MYYSYYSFVKEKIIPNIVVFSLLILLSGGLICLTFVSSLLWNLIILSPLLAILCGGFIYFLFFQNFHSKFGNNLSSSPELMEQAEAPRKIKDPHTVELLIATALEDKDSAVRGRAARVLGEIKDPRAVESLIAALKDKDADVRWEAGGALAKIGKPAVHPLIAALKNEAWSVRTNAAWALGKIKDPRAVEPLIAALKDEDLLFQMEVAEALGKIIGENFGEDQVKWQEWWEENKGKFRMGKGEEVKR